MPASLRERYFRTHATAVSRSPRPGGATVLRPTQCAGTGAGPLAGASCHFLSELADLFRAGCVETCSTSWSSGLHRWALGLGVGEVSQLEPPATGTRRSSRSPGVHPPGKPRHDRSRDDRSTRLRSPRVGQGRDRRNLAAGPQALEAFVDNPHDRSRLGFCRTYVHQVYGTLQMVEFYGAALLAEEMELLCSPSRRAGEQLGRGAGSPDAGHPAGAALSGPGSRGPPRSATGHPAAAQRPALGAREKLLSKPACSRRICPPRRCR